MACCQLGDKPSPNIMLKSYQLDHKDHISMEYYEIQKFSLKKNAFENVIWKMSAVLLRPQYHHCGVVTPNMATKIRVNIGSGNGMVFHSTKPLPEPMLTQHQ